MKNEIISNVTTREKLINRVEVLDRVKKLLLIPRMQFTTIQGVADFYEVSTKAISSIVNRHRAELDEDGLTKISKKEILQRLIQDEGGVKTVRTAQFVEVFISDDYSVKISNGPTFVFPKRAILRVGMLLTESEVAREVRTQLLNIEENSSDEVKVKEIDTELNLLGQTLTSAFIDNDIEAFAKASIKLNQYTNRHKDATIKALRSENEELKITLDEVMLKNNELKVLNSALSADLAQVTNSEAYRRVLKSMMKRLTIKRNFNREWICWNEFYTLLRDKLDINLGARKYSDIKPKSKIDYIVDEEWPQVLATATALCHRYNVEISDLLLDLERNEVA